MTNTYLDEVKGRGRRMDDMDVRGVRAEIANWINTWQVDVEDLLCRSLNTLSEHSATFGLYRHQAEFISPSPNPRLSPKTITMFPIL